MRVSFGLRPGGTADHSPARKCWVGGHPRSSVPEGRQRRHASAVPPGLGSSGSPLPSTKVLGYSRPSLRDEDQNSPSSRRPVVPSRLLLCPIPRLQVLVQLRL